LVEICSPGLDPKLHRRTRNEILDAVNRLLGPGPPPPTFQAPCEAAGGWQGAVWVTGPRRDGAARFTAGSGFSLVHFLTADAADDAAARLHGAALFGGYLIAERKGLDVPKEKGLKEAKLAAAWNPVASVTAERKDLAIPVPPAAAASRCRSPTPPGVCEAGGVPRAGVAIPASILTQNILTEYCDDQRPFFFWLPDTNLVNSGTTSQAAPHQSSAHQKALDIPRNPLLWTIILLHQHRRCPWLHPISAASGGLCVHPVASCLFSTGTIARVGRGIDPEARAASGSPGIEPGRAVAFAAMFQTSLLQPHQRPA
jgi:hypothetical protein